MQIIYNIGLRSYYLLIRIAALWNPKAEKWIRGRKAWKEEVARAFKSTDRVAWFHCASLGEFEQGRPVIEAVREAHPGKKVLLTFFSPSGYEKRNDFAGADLVCYLPLDTAANAKAFFNLVPVEQALFIKYEFWYHFLKRLHKQKVPTYLISGHFRKSQVFFRWYGGFFRSMLRCFTHIFVQTESSATLLGEIGLRNVTIAGDTRFDRVMQIASHAPESTALKAFAANSNVIIAGSTWEADENCIKAAFETAHENCKLIIAPHEVAAGNVDRLMEYFPGATRYSQLDETAGIKGRVIIVDTIGHLSSLYRYGTIAFVGGGFGKGIHNILEATANGLPVFFGPNYRNFSEAVDLVTKGGAFPVHNSAETASGINSLLGDRDRLQQISKRVQAFTSSRTGATRIIMDHL